MNQEGAKEAATKIRNVTDANDLDRLWDVVGLRKAALNNERFESVKAGDGVRSTTYNKLGLVCAKYDGDLEVVWADNGSYARIPARYFEKVEGFCLCESCIWMGHQSNTEDPCADCQVDTGKPHNFEPRLKRKG